jgi:predicted phage terminase large subunit-like protein
MRNETNHPRHNFLMFSAKAFEVINGAAMTPYPYLVRLAEKLARVATGKTKWLVVNLPPRHFKTWMGTICLCAWILARNPSAKIMVLTYGQELADKIAYAIREILASEWYRGLFKKTRLAKNRAKLTDFVTTAGGAVRSVSIEGSVTGFGADFIIIDDPVEIKDWDNAKRLERVNGLFDTEIRTRLDRPKRGSIVIIAHRISEDDLSGHVLQQGGWKHLKLPLIARDKRCYELDDGTTWQRQQEELLRPGDYTHRDIERLRDSKSPGFETLQQQDPGRRERVRIKAEHFPSFSPADLPMSQSGLVLSIDPGQKAGPNHSYTVVQVWSPDGDVHRLLDQFREQASYPDLRSAVRKLIRHYRPSAVLIEATGQGPSLISELKRKPQPGMTVYEIDPVDGKTERIRRHLPIIRAGRIQLPGNASWREDFIAEMTLFPYASFDDQVDAVAQYLDWIATHPNPPKRPKQALAVAVNSRGGVLPPADLQPSTQTRGMVVLRGRRRW